MICRCLVVSLISLSICASKVPAIPCDFQFIECDVDDLIDSSNFTIPPTTTTTSTVAPIPDDAFDCEQTDDFIVEKPSSKKPASPENPVTFANSDDDDDYEDIESTCQVQRRTIQPKALNNIYNQLKRVVNTASFVQSITIEQCLNKAEECNSGVVPPRGKKHICRQKHVKITLKALREDSKVVDEQFYYPSHCVCELVTVKKKNPGPRKCKPINPFL